MINIIYESHKSSFWRLSFLKHRLIFHSYKVSNEVSETVCFQTFLKKTFPLFWERISFGIGDRREMSIEIGIKYGVGERSYKNWREDI